MWQTYHVAIKCFKWFDVNFHGVEPNSKNANATRPPSQGNSVQANLMHHQDGLLPSPSIYHDNHSESVVPSHTSGSPWYIDSDATHHVTNQSSHLSNTVLFSHN